MKRKSRVLIFFLMIAVLMNISIASDRGNKQFIYFGFSKINAENEWILLKSWRYDGSWANEYKFTFEPNKYNYRLRGSFEGAYSNVKMVVKTVGGYLVWQNVLYAIDKPIVIVYDSLDNGKTYIIFDDEWNVNPLHNTYVYFERQLKNSDPAIAVTFPSPNETLQPGNMKYKEVA